MIRAFKFDVFIFLVIFFKFFNKGPTVVDIHPLVNITVNNQNGHIYVLNMFKWGQALDRSPLNFTCEQLG